MDIEIEKIIVKSFFAKRLQDRVLFELSSSKKRKDALSRLSHTYFTTLREKYMFEIPKPNSDPFEIAKLMKEHGAGELCYAISWDEEIDGRELSLLTALEVAVGEGFPTIISCIPGKLAYFEAEQEYGPPPRFILSRKE
ncbi:hypothetical protein [Bacillus sp. V59.32b]|uniref:hypothetical protein n=1 Tax=Bacillus sp. V59.32b TaxID=1758642 RepID=UPI000E3DE952|nr:hypothetical protein [Bacillus sp. V59.32b]RFU60133.1 hypothetical protein D0463_18520 [Bacillus sp. V59.32b]